MARFASIVAHRASDTAPDSRHTQRSLLAEVLMFIQEKKTALVTGASSGMGKAIARRLIQEGYQVYVAARQLGKMDDLASLGAQCLQMDLTTGRSVGGREHHSVSDRRGRCTGQ